MNSPCIKSTHYLDRNGYAQIRHEGKTEYHHRVAYVLANKLRMLDIAGQYVLHACDNPACINPAHLSLGSAADNTADMVAKGRARGMSRPGASNLASKLTAEDVLAIRAARATQVELAAKYGVTQANISSIVQRKTWKHI
jgi:Zinc-binding loop region of homing endonuclease